MRTTVESVPLPGDAERVVVAVEADAWLGGGPEVASLSVEQRGPRSFKVTLHVCDEFGGPENEHVVHVDLAEPS